jgi:hypothetical protein
MAPQDINRGHGSFRRAMKFYKAFKEETGWTPTLHPVLSKYTIPYLFETVKWFCEMETAPGATSPPNFRWLPGDANIWTEEDFSIYKEQLELIKRWYIDNDIRSKGFFIRAFMEAEQALLGTNPAVEVKRNNDRCCSAGNSLMAILPNGKMVPCHHEYWSAKDCIWYEETEINDDCLGINHMSEIYLKDIAVCNSCPQWGCCVCPGSFFFHSRTYTSPDKNWCRAGKMVIETAKEYVEELQERQQRNSQKIEYLAAGVDYLLQRSLEHTEK